MFNWIEIFNTLAAAFSISIWNNSGCCFYGVCCLEFITRYKRAQLRKYNANHLNCVLKVPSYRGRWNKAPCIIFIFAFKNNFRWKEVKNRKLPAMVQCIIMLLERIFFYRFVFFFLGLQLLWFSSVCNSLYVSKYHRFSS